MNKHKHFALSRLGISALIALVCIGGLGACSTQNDSDDQASSESTQAEETSAETENAENESNDGESTETVSDTKIDATGDWDVEASDEDVAKAIAENTSEMDFDYSDRDKDASYDAENACSISIDGSSAEISGDGASCENGMLSITQEGSYIISGQSDDMQIVVDADDSSKVQLVLDGVYLSCENGPCINISGGDKIFITLADGSENSLADGNGFTISDESDEANATIYSTSDLCLNGNGSLNITASAKHGISSKDDLIITGGTYTIDSAADALRGKDCVKILDGDFTLDAGSDGIVSSNDSEGDRGFISIDGGNFNIDADDDGIQGTRYIRTEDGSLTISAGDDAIHSDNDLSIDGADISITAGDDAVHCEFNLHVAGGNLNVESCYEGIEGESILVSGGENLVYSKDDGINASKGSTESSDESPEESEGGRGDAPMTGMEEGGFGEQGSVNIIGGRTILICSENGDSLDSNGSLNMSGGVVLISGTTSNDNGALDYDTDATITGGTILALGSTGMAQSFGSDSTQASIVTTVENGTADELVSITDDSGNVIVSFKAVNDFDWVLASSPNIADGESYHVCVGGSASNGDAYGYAESGQVEGSTDLGSIEASTEAQGMMGMGGMQGGGGMEGAGDMSPKGGDPSQGGDKPSGNGPSDETDDSRQAPSDDMPDRGAESQQ